MAIVCDIDGCISFNTERSYLIKTDPQKWDEFFSRCNEDVPLRGMITILDMIDVTQDVILLTSRPDTCRDETEQWLHDNEIGYDKLIMQVREGDQDGNSAMAADWKVQQLEALEVSGYTIDVVIEDEPKTFMEMMEHGYPVIPIYSGYYCAYPSCDEIGNALAKER